MKVTFLGTGTSHGVPTIGCHCEVCTSADTYDKRLRSSILVEAGGKTVVVDTGPDFRTQMLREQVDVLNAVVYTHEHKDHTAGMDDIRAYNFENGDMDIYATTRVQANLRKSFDYIFSPIRYPGIPQVHFVTIDKDPFYIGNARWQPIEVMHLNLPVLGFRVHDFVYITDANSISQKEMEKIDGAKVLVLNALRIAPHISHFNLEEAIDMAKKLKVEKTYFTHISHQLGRHAEVQAALPEGIFLAYDGLSITFPE